MNFSLGLESFIAKAVAACRMSRGFMVRSGRLASAERPPQPLNTYRPTSVGTTV